MNGMPGALTTYYVTTGTTQSILGPGYSTDFPGILTCGISDLSASYFCEWSNSLPPFGSSGVSTSADLATPTTLTIAYGAPKVSINEILIYDGTLSSSDIASVQSYLNTKWGGISQPGS